jgi:ubiquinone/menaquinone biosynthesis C-methylase UbiE
MNNKWDTDEAIKRWDKYADEMSMAYTEDGDLNRQFLLNPAFDELIGEVKNKKVFDAGCGEGYLCRLLAERGAEVLGVDYSKNMIEVAIKKTPEGMEIKYKRGNCEKLDFLDDNSFDVIVSNMVLHDLAKFKDAINEMYRLLVKDGISVFSILHPCFDTPESGWIKNEQGEKQYWKVNRYFQEGAYEQRSSSKNKLIWFHRTLSSYFNALIEAGFCVESIIEPKPSDEAVKAHPDFKNFHNMCHFLVFKVRK